MEIISAVLKALSFILIILALSLSSIGSLHIFQLNSYQIKSHLNRVKDNPRQLAPNIIFSALALLALIIDGIPKYIYLDCIFTAACAASRPKKAKKPLVYTARVKRQLATTALICAAATAVCLICISYEAAVTARIALYFLSPWLTITAALINKPIEKSISNSYIKDAKRILASIPEMRIIGVTGSYGKTSVKHYLTTLLSADYNVLMTPGSYNTPMGVVRTIREKLKSTDRIFVCEMGARHVGDIKEICDIVSPQDGIITSVGPQHLETFHTLDNIKKTKFELADAVYPDGLLFLNMDDENVAACSHGRKFIGYGIKNRCGYYAEDITVSERGTEFTAVSPKGEKCRYSTRLIGTHNVLNILGAIAVANTYGTSMEKLKTQVRRLECVPHRLELKDYGSAAVIDDAYNANPSGTKAALEVLGIFDGFKILVTPGMVELGESQDECNREFGKNAANVCDYVILIDKRQTESIFQGLCDAGYDKEKIYIAPDIRDAVAKAYAVDSAGKKRFILLENDLPDNY